MRIRNGLLGRPLDPQNLLPLLCNDAKNISSFAVFSGKDANALIEGNDVVVMATEIDGSVIQLAGTGGTHARRKRREAAQKIA